MNELTDIKTLFGKKIKEIRNKRGFTQEELAEQIGIGERNLSKIECGNNFVTAETLAKILLALDIDAIDLFNFKHNQDKQTLKNELITAINNEEIDITLMYKFYQSIK